MKKLALLISAIMIPSAFAGNVQWAEQPLEFEKERIAAVSKLNDAISKAGSHKQLIIDSKKEDAEAKYQIAQSYLYGIAEEKSLNKAFSLLSESAEMHHSEANFQLGKMKLGLFPMTSSEKSMIDMPSGIKHMKEAAEQGVGEAQYWIGVHYIQGDLLHEDRDLGLFWLTRSIYSGYEPAAKVRDELLSQRASNKESFEYVQRRAIQGNAEYLVELAQFYIDGWVVQRDTEKAKRLLVDASELGSKRAADKLREMSVIK